MKTKRADIPCDYRAFDNPYTGIATMIFVQAVMDLKSLEGEERLYKGGCLINKWEIINFLRSSWAATLATGIGLDQVELDRYACGVT